MKKLCIGALLLLGFLPAPAPRQASPDLYTDRTLKTSIQVIRFNGTLSALTTPKMWLEGSAYFSASGLPEGSELHAFYESPQRQWMEAEYIEGPTYCMLALLACVGMAPKES